MLACILKKGEIYGFLGFRDHFSTGGQNGGFRFYVTTSLVPIFFGMRKHSIPATIISSVVIVMLISSTSPGFSISSVVYIPLSLAAFGLLFSYMAIRNADKQDA